MQRYFLRVINRPKNAYCINRFYIDSLVGAKDSFDILREEIIAEKIQIDDVTKSTQLLFNEVQRIDFADDFFHASGAGRVRIKNVIKHIS